MDTHLDKAKGALEHAREFDNRSPQQDDLLLVARIQAEVAQADALERIAGVLERIAPALERSLSPRVLAPELARVDL